MMIEIDEVMPLYLCDKTEACGLMFGCEDCDKHTNTEICAKNKDSVELLNNFFKTFSIVIDDYGRLVCTEKEKDEESN